MKAVIFDLDGTLLNSLDDIGNACNQILAQNGMPTHPLAAYAHMVGNGFTMLVARALPPGLKLDEARFNELVAAARDYYSQHMTERTIPYPGMVETLRKMSLQNIRLAVLSNKPDKMSEILIGRYFPDIPFTHVQGARDGVPLKPDPAALNAILAEIGAQTAYYTGDSDVDVITAHNAGIKAIGAAWGFRGEAELVRTGADFVFQEPAEMLSLFSGAC